MEKSNVSFTNSKPFGIVKRGEKFTDTRIVASVNNTGSVTYFTAPALGTQSYQRIADLITLKKLELFYYAQYGDAIGNNLRFCIFQTRGGYAPTGPSDVLDLGASGSVDFSSPWKGYLIGNRVEVLYDQTISLTESSTSANQVFKCNLPIKVRDVEFDNGTTTAINGGIYFLYISDSTLAPNPSIGIVLRAIHVDP